MKINLKNVGDQILSDRKLRGLLPHLSHHFDSWRLGVQFPALRPTAKKAALDMLMALDAESIKVLEEHFGTSVSVESIDYNIVKNVEFRIDDAEFNLAGTDGFEFCLTTDGEVASVTLWR